MLLCSELTFISLYAAPVGSRCLGWMAGAQLAGLCVVGFRQQKHRSVKGLITEVILLVCSVSAYLWLSMYIKNIEKKTELIWDRAGAAKGGQEEDVCFSAGSLCWTSLQKEKKDIVVSSPELGSVWAHTETSTSQSSTNTTQTWPDVNLSNSNDSCIR